MKIPVALQSLFTLGPVSFGNGEDFDTPNNGLGFGENRENNEVNCLYSSRAGRRKFPPKVMIILKTPGTF